MRVLGIESSCDDTSAALLDCSEQGCFVIRELTASQIEIHKKYGGVVPEVAGRMHAEKIVPLIEEVLAGERPDTIAVTAGPGLITGLLVGVEAARTLSYAWDLPLARVNHIEGHIHAVEIGKEKIAYPALALVVSGGHTEIIFAKKPGDYKLIGSTRDDAAGECFDKVAKLLGLPYPGGPEISRLAQSGQPDAIDFPRPMARDDNFDFSFAGLKTSALYWLRDHKLSAENIIPYDLPTGVFGQSSHEPTIHDFCASFEQAIVDVLVGKILRAIKELHPKTVILAGGVSANQKLRTTLAQEVRAIAPQCVFMTPEIKYCMDNAAMIAVAGYHLSQDKKFTKWDKIGANPNWNLA